MKLAYLKLILPLFIISTFFGMVFQENILFDNFIQDSQDEILSKNSIEIFMSIFSHNLIITFLSLIFGTIFGIVPIIGTLINGLFLGYIISQYPSITPLLKISSYALIEISAILISFSLGTSLGFERIKHYFKKNKKKKGVIILTIGIIGFLMIASNSIISMLTSLSLVIKLILIILGAIFLAPSIIVFFKFENRKEKKEYFNKIGENLIIYSKIVIPLLLIAAIIETIAIIIW